MKIRSGVFVVVALLFSVAVWPEESDPRQSDNEAKKLSVQGEPAEKADKNQTGEASQGLPGQPAVSGQEAASPQKRPANEMPMYGGEIEPKNKPDKLLSEPAARLGWKYYYADDLDTAMRRFNQAWLFDQNSFDAYWGFGLVMGRRALEEETEKNLRESVKFLEIALKAAPAGKKARVSTDLAFSYTQLGAVYLDDAARGKDRDAAFARAGTLYASAEKLDRSYPLTFYNWSVLKFYQGNYPAARALLQRAIKLGHKPNPEYVQDLEGKLRSGAEKQAN